jgi:ADP-heptose:LPS heptosyltransferase
MARQYSRKKILVGKMLEIVAAVFLLPAVWLRRPRPAVRKILLVEPFQMGDVLSLTVLFRPLREHYGEAELYVLTKPSSGAILGMVPGVKVVAADFPWSDHGEKSVTMARMIRAMRETWKLRALDFDLGIDTRGDIRSQLLMVLAGCRMRLGYKNYLHSNMNTWGWLLTHHSDPPKYKHRFEWNLFLLTALGMAERSLLPVALPSVELSDKVEPPSGRYPVVHVGGGWIYRRWPEENWIALIRWLALRVDRVYVIGGAGEKEILDRIGAATQENVNVQIEVTDLVGLVYRISDCRFFVGLDSGPMNLAACLNKPSVALFGPGDTEMWRPLSAGSEVIRRTENFPCSPCLQLTCLHPGRNCMHAIQVADVVSILERFLKDPSNLPSTP